MQNRRNTLLFLLILTLLVSCKTGKNVDRLSAEGYMYAMVYDYDNTQVSGVTVYINNKKAAVTDIHGRVVLENVKSGQYKIKLEKRGYETYEGTFQYDPMNVLYFKMINASQLLSYAEVAIEDSDFTNAQIFLDRAIALEPNRPDIMFLQSILYYTQGKNEEAMTVLEDIIKTGGSSPSIFQMMEIIRQENIQQEVPEEPHEEKDGI